MRYEAPSDIKGKDLFRHLIANKGDIIKAKKAMPIKSMPISVGAPIQESDREKSLYIQKGIVQKMAMPAFGEDFSKRVIGNLCGWMDYYDDVSMKGSFNRTVNNNAGMMYFLRNHSDSTNDIIARMNADDVTVENITLNELGIESDVAIQEAIVFRGMFSKELDPQAYYSYYYDMAKQHSISLQYVKLELAVNDEEFEEEYKVWQRVFSQVINKSKALAKGYFWAIEEQKVFENSWVLKGANSQTPIMPDDQNSKTTPISEPAPSTSQKKDSVSLFNHLFTNRNGY